MSQDKEVIKEKIKKSISLGNTFAYVSEKELQSTDWSELINWLKDAGLHAEIDDYNYWKVLKILW